MSCFPSSDDQTAHESASQLSPPFPPGPLGGVTHLAALRMTQLIFLSAIGLHDRLVVANDREQVA